MKPLFLISLVLFFSFAGAATAAASERFSLKDLEKALKSDASVQGNSELAREVLERGVSFQYTEKREKKLRKWGANDELIAAIWQSIVDKREAGRLFEEFMNSYRSSDKEIRKRALDKGKEYLSRFEENERFREYTTRVQKEVGVLACEFDPDLGC